MPFSMDIRGSGLFRELSGGLGAKAAQTRFPIADNFFTYRRLIVDTHQDGKNESSPTLLFVGLYFS